jgi:hypothetical protein
VAATIVCPSGLSGEIRGLKGREGEILSDRVAARAGSTFDKILSGCWLETTDAGFYTFADGRPDWSQVLVGDRFYALLQIRALTFGNSYAFAVQCPAQTCRERFEWEIDLGELPVKELPESSKEALRAGNRLETALGDGRKVWFKLLRGADEVRASKGIKTSGYGALLAAVNVRILEVEGVADKGRRAFLEELDLGELAALLDRFDEADGGVETSIEVECPHCFEVQEIDLPFGRDFFLPRAKTSRAE